MESNSQDIFDKLADVENYSADFFVPITFEPFSFVIVQEIKKLRSRIEVYRLYESIFADERAKCINQNSLAKTVLFPNHKTNDEFWPETKEMAFALNEYGIDVCFLPEVGDKLIGVKRADAIIKVDGKWSIADFKYFHSTNGNTLTSDLENGFIQASTIVLKLQNADTGILKDAIEYLKRNKKIIGNLLLINEYDRIIEIKKRQIESGRYKHIIKGFL